MKRFAIVNRLDGVSAAFAHIIEKRLYDGGWVKDDSNPEIVIFVGGDGTMLETFHRFKHVVDTASFVGIHTGSLGFYADWQKEEVDDFVHCLLSESGNIVQYPLLEMTVGESTYLALNEITVKNTSKTFIGDVYLNGLLFEQFRGDGLCISTPTGSTAYNKGLNGAIIHPTIECMQLTEMASINNKIYRTLGSSVVLPKHHSLEIKYQIATDDSVITLDHLKLPLPESGDASLKFQVSAKKVSFIRCRKYPFWKRVKETFI